MLNPFDLIDSKYSTVHAVAHESPSELKEAFDRLSDVSLNSCIPNSLVAKIHAEVFGLTEAEAPHSQADREMALSNPIHTVSLQDFAPGQFSPTIAKTPTRLADRPESLQGFPAEQRRVAEEAVHSRAPAKMTSDWYANVPDKLLSPDYNPDTAPETEVFPIFSQYRDQAWMLGGPASVLVASKNEAEGDDDEGEDDEEVDGVDADLNESVFDPNGKSLEVLLNTHARNCAHDSDHCREVAKNIEDYVRTTHGKDAFDNLRAYSALGALGSSGSMVGDLRHKADMKRYQDEFYKSAENHLHTRRRAGV